jgi:hypothetical protein
MPPVGQTTAVEVEHIVCPSVRKPGSTHAYVVGKNLPEPVISARCWQRHDLCRGSMLVPIIGQVVIVVPHGDQIVPNYGCAGIKHWRDGGFAGGCGIIVDAKHDVRS